MFCVVPVTNEYILGHTLNWKNITSMYPDKPGMYRYLLDKTKFLAMYSYRIRTEDLTHTKRQIIPLRYEREHIGDIDGSYKVYIHCAGH